MNGVKWASPAALVGGGGCVSPNTAESGKALPRARILALLLAAGLLVPVQASQALAAESAFSAYGLGTAHSQPELRRLPAPM
jgi:hypothetical protein